MKHFFSRYAKDELGATAIEYGLIATMISLAVITAMNAVGSGLITVYNRVASNLI